MNLEFLDYNSEIHFLIKNYSDEANGKHKNLMPFSGHGMRCAPARGIPDLLTDINLLKQLNAKDEIEKNLIVMENFITGVQEKLHISPLDVSKDYKEANTVMIDLD